MKAPLTFKQQAVQRFRRDLAYGYSEHHTPNCDNDWYRTEERIRRGYVHSRVTAESRSLWVRKQDRLRSYRR